MLFANPFNLYELIIWYLYLRSDRT